jgi:hypothetical protein
LAAICGRVLFPDDDQRMSPIEDQRLQTYVHLIAN